MTTINPDRGERFLERPLPSSEEAERCVLGAILLDNAVMSQAVEAIKPEDFYSPLNRRVFAAMSELFQASRVIDPILIGEELKKEGSLESIGGTTTVTNLTFGLPHFSDIAEYLKIIAEKSRIRNLIRTLNSATGELLSEEDDFDDVISSVESKIFEACERPNAPKGSRLSDLVRQNIEITEQRMNAGVELTGIPTGLKALDEMTGGLQNGELVIGASRPSMGKSSWAVGVAKNGSDENRGCAYFSLEDPNETTVSRIIAAQSGFDLKLWRAARVTPAMLDMAKADARILERKELYLFDMPRVTPMQVLAKARRIRQERGLHFIVIDYLQKITPSKPSKSGNRVQDVSQISGELKEIAMELSVPVLALSQLSRDCEHRNPPRPQLSDLRDSGSIEQDADTVIFLYREAYYPHLRTEKNEGTAEFIVSKQRNGPTGSVKAAFLKRYVRFDNLADDHENRQQSL